MSERHEDDDFEPTNTPGYKPAAAKTLDEYAQLDAEDESLARWKASLGIVPGAASVPAGRKVEVLTLELQSPTLPPGKRVIMNLQNTSTLATWKENPVHIKEGVEYNVCITFVVNGTIVNGLRYLQVVKRGGLRVDKMDVMLGSYGPAKNNEPYTKRFETEESPSGLLARGTYAVRSRITDDDGQVYLDWDWAFKLSKDW